MTPKFFAQLIVAVACVRFGWKPFGFSTGELRPPGINNDDYIGAAPWGKRPEEIAVRLANGIADVKMKFHNWILP